MLFNQDVGYSFIYKKLLKTLHQSQLQHSSLEMGVVTRCIWISSCIFNFNGSLFHSYKTYIFWNEILKLIKYVYWGLSSWRPWNRETCSHTHTVKSLIAFVVLGGYKNQCGLHASEGIHIASVSAWRTEVFTLSQRKEKIEQAPLYLWILH